MLHNVDSFAVDVTIFQFQHILNRLLNSFIKLYLYLKISPCNIKSGQTDPSQAKLNSNSPASLGFMLLIVE